MVGVAHICTVEELRGRDYDFYHGDRGIVRLTKNVIWYV